MAIPKRKNIAVTLLQDHARDIIEPNKINEFEIQIEKLTALEIVILSLKVKNIE